MRAGFSRRISQLVSTTTPTSGTWSTWPGCGYALRLRPNGSRSLPRSSMRSLATARRPSAGNKYRSQTCSVLSATSREAAASTARPTAGVLSETASTLTRRPEIPRAPGATLTRANPSTTQPLGGHSDHPGLGRQPSRQAARSRARASYRPVRPDRCRHAERPRTPVGNPRHLGAGLPKPPPAPDSYLHGRPRTLPGVRDPTDDRTQGQVDPTATTPERQGT